MGVSITSRPDKEISAGYESRWLAINGGYPVNFTFYRKDYALSSVQDDGNGFTELRIASNITLEINAGDSVFFSSNAMGDFTTVITNYQYNGTHTVIQTSQPFTAGSTDTNAANYINLLSGRADYRLYIQVYGKPNNEQLFEGSYRVAPSGKLEFDVGGAITPHVSLDLNTTFPAINQANTETTQPFYIQFAEFYGGSLFDYEYDLIYRGVNAANQILDSYGVNMGDRVAFNGDITPKAKWLTSFESPRYWPNYPFKLSTIFEAQGAQPQITREQEKFNEAGSSTGTDSTNLAASNDWAYINEVSTTIDAMASTVYEVDLWLESDLAGNPCAYLATLTQPQIWIFSDPTIITSTDPAVEAAEVIFRIRVQPNPLSGITAVTSYPDMTVSDGVTSVTYTHSSGGYYFASSTQMGVVAGGTYTFTIASLGVTIYGTSCTTSFSQAWTNGTGGGGAYDASYDESYN